MKGIRGLGLAALVVVTCLVLLGLVSKEAAESIVWYRGVWVLWVVVFLAGYGFWHARKQLAARPWFDRRGLIIALVLSGLMHVNFPHRFKILADEMVLVGVSKTIHEERQPVVPLTLVDVGGAQKIGIGYLDKRPFFFPLLVSVLHDLTGYRPENSLVLNALLTPVLFYLVFLAAWRITGEVVPGWVAMGMVAAVPLFAHNATGGGFELLNVILILAMFLWGWEYTRSGDVEYQVGFVATAILLAYTRYESVLFLGAAAALLIAVWIRQRSVAIHPFVLLSPVLVIPLGCIFRVVMADPTAWFQLKDKGSASAFAWSFLPSNVSHALNFFFSDENALLGSMWISGACALGTIFAAVAAVRRLRREPGAFCFWAPAWVGFVVVANFVVLLCYHWGQLDDYLVSRLAIPFLVLLVLITVFAAREFPRRNLVYGGLAFLSLFSFYAVEIPTASKNHIETQYRGARELEAVQTFLRNFRHPDKLVLTDRPLYWMCYGVWTQDIRGAIVGRHYVEDWLRVGRYSHVYIVQQFSYSAAKQGLVLKEGHATPAEWTLTEVARRRTSDDEVIIFSEIRVPPGPVSSWPPDGTPVSSPKPALDGSPKGAAAMPVVEGSNGTR